MTFAAVGAWVAEAVVLTAFEAGVTGMLYAGLYYAVAAGVAMVGWSLVASALAPKQSGASQADQGILVNTSSTADPLPVIYGYRRFGGTRVLSEVSSKSGTTFSDKKNGYLHLIIAHCEGEIASIPNIYADNKDIWDYDTFAWYYIKYPGTDAQAACSALITATTISLTGTYSQSGTTVTITATAHKRAVGETLTLDYTSGTAVDGAFVVVSVPTVDTLTVTAAGSLTTSGDVSISASKWTANHKLSGVAYTWLVLKYDTNVWKSFPTITADINGRKIYDTRSGLTVWSDNPALIIRDYLTNTRYGRGVSASDIDDTSITAAANTCDELVATPTGTQKRYRINAIVDTSQPALDNLRHMLTSCRGVLIFTGGKYKLIIDQATSPTFTFSEDNIIGAWSIKLGEKRARFNRVRANWINPDNEWQPAITVRDSTTFRSADNGLMLEAQIEYPYVTDPYQVQRLADMHLKQSRFGITCSFRATIAGMLCEVGDVVNITHPTPGWIIAKPFRVMRIGLLSSDEVEVTCTEYDASVYTPDTLTVPRVSETTNLPLFGTPTAPTALTLASGDTHRLISPDGIVTPRIYASWTGSDDAQVTEYEVQFKKTTESVYTSLFVPATETGTYLAPMQYGAGYDVRIRAVNIAGFNSAWISGTHTVTASPSQPNDLPIDVQTFTSGGTWTKPSRGRVAMIECWGGGGGGGRNAAAGGGGGGLYVSAWIPLSSLGATETVSVGAGGAGISSATIGSGSSGGNSMFGSLVTSYGGQGGIAGTIPTNPGGGGGGNGDGVNNTGKNGGGGGSYTGSPAKASPSAGGGGGSGSSVILNSGGDSTEGGGGGGGYRGGGGNFGLGGASVRAGSGGAAGGNTSAAQPGQAPSGGGGASMIGSYASGDGGAGKVRVTVW
jgi:hypothetical protein